MFLCLKVLHLKKFGRFFVTLKWVYDISSPQNVFISLQSDDRNETAVLIHIFRVKSL